MHRFDAIVLALILTSGIAVSQEKTQAAGKDGQAEVLDVGARLLRKGRLGPETSVAYSVRLLAGKPYLIDMISADPKTLDPFLRVLDASGRELVTDDDTGGGVHSRLVFRPEVAGVYQVMATSFELGKGAFTLTIQPYGVKEAQALPRDDVKRALQQASKFWNEHRYPEATSMFEILLAWMEGVPQRDGAHIAQALENLCSTYSSVGRYINAEWAAREAVAVREARVGKEHPDLSDSLCSLAGVLLETGRYVDAEREYARSLKLVESKLGANHPLVARSLRGVASCYSSMGKYPKAEPMHRRVLQIVEANHGPSSEEAAQALESLASFLADNMGRYADAEPLFLRGLEMRRRLYAENHANVATSMSHVARLYRYMEQYAKAEPLALRAAQITEANLGKEHVYLGGDLLNLALIYAAMGQPAKAEPLFLRSVSIFEKVFGPDNHALGVILTMPANMYRETGRFDKAEPLYRRGLRIAEQNLGKEHPTTTDTLHNLAWNYAGQKQWTRAIEHAQAARVRTSQYLAEVLPALSEPEQLALLEVKFKKSLDFALSLGLAAPKDAVDASAEWLLNGKAIAHQTLAEQQILFRDAKAPAAQRLVEALKATRSRLAAHINRTPTPGQESAYQKEMGELRASEREQAQNLARAAGRPHLAGSWVPLITLRAKLGKDAVFVDIARFPAFDFEANRWRKARYAAWITPPADAGAVQLIDLGDADAIDELVRQARVVLFESAKGITKVGEEDALKEANKHMQALAAKVLHPLLPVIEKYQEWNIAPDGALWLAPWSALPLPKGDFAVEKHLIRHVVSGRDLLPTGDTLNARSAYVFADPDYDLVPGKAAMPSEVRGASNSVAGRRLRGVIGTWNVSFEFLDKEVVIYDEDDGGTVAGKGTWKQEPGTLTMQTGISRFTGKVAGNAVEGERTKRDEAGKTVQDAFRISLSEETRALGPALKTLPKVARLPGTALEAELVAPQIHKWLGEEPRVHLSAKASEAIVKEITHPKVLVLATHGYFLPLQVAASKDRADADPRRRPMLLADAQGQALENPLLRCGLLLAGCNKRAEARLGEDDGILTGLEIVGMDLRGANLVVLSACETGLGDIRNGEGVAGLRQAFQLAGARGVLASLWQVPDRETALLMNAFYGELAKGKSQAAALREAQLSRIAARRASFGAAHPFFWGAFALTSK